MEVDSKGYTGMHVAKNMILHGFVFFGEYRFLGGVKGKQKETCFRGP